MLAAEKAHKIGTEILNKWLKIYSHSMFIYKLKLFLSGEQKSSTPGNLSGLVRWRIKKFNPANQQT